MHSTSACQLLDKLHVRNWKETVSLFNCLIRTGEKRCQGNRKARRPCSGPFERGQSFHTSGIGYNNAIKIKLNGENCQYTSKAIHMDFMEQGHVALSTKTELCRA